MNLETRFSVILPAKSFLSAQVVDFEMVCRQQGLMVHLPLRRDALGNVVASQGLTLQEAQTLRRQIATLGFSADVVNDRSDDNRLSQSSVSATRVARTPQMERASRQNLDSISEFTADAWMSLEMQPLDLGLSEENTSELEAKKNLWPKDDMSSKTLSVDAKALLKALGDSDETASVQREPYYTSSLDEAQFVPERLGPHTAQTYEELQPIPAKDDDRERESLPPPPQSPPRAPLQELENYHKESSGSLSSLLLWCLLLILITALIMTAVYYLFPEYFPDWLLMPLDLPQQAS